MIIFSKCAKNKKTINRILQNNKGNMAFHFAYNIVNIKYPQYPFIIFMILELL